MNEREMLKKSLKFFRHTFLCSFERFQTAKVKKNPRNPPACDCGHDDLVKSIKALPEKDSKIQVKGLRASAKPTDSVQQTAEPPFLVVENIKRAEPVDAHQTTEEMQGVQEDFIVKSDGTINELLLNAHLDKEGNKLS
jgi:hypothetical protein